MFRSKAHCPICGSTAQFQDFRGRKHAQCSACGSLERHRQLWLWLIETGWIDRLPNARVLDVAPQTGVSEALQARANSYLSVDLLPGAAMAVADLTDLRDHTDASYDLILCSHVLEHIPDDGAALRELFRVLAAGGVAVLTVPMRGPVTHEDLTLEDPAERAALFGQDDHIRRYGFDFLDRIGQAGFRAEAVDVRDITTEKQRVVAGLAMHIPWIPPDAPELWVLPVGRKD